MGKDELVGILETKLTCPNCGGSGWYGQENEKGEQVQKQCNCYDYFSSVADAILTWVVGQLPEKKSEKSEDYEYEIQPGGFETVAEAWGWNECIDEMKRRFE